MEALTYTFTLPPLAQQGAAAGLSTPVLLPFGPLTMASIGSASIGVLVPFGIFLAVIFAFNYGLWHENVAPLLQQASAPSAPRHNRFSATRRPTPGGGGAAIPGSFFRAPGGYARVPTSAPMQPFFRAAA